MKKLAILSILFISLAFVAPIQASAATNAGIKPGSFFYFFDTTFENIGLFFTFNSEDKAKKALEYADERLVEIEAVAEEKNPNAVKTAIANYESNIALATEKSKEVKDKGRAESLLTSIADNTARNQEVLSAVLIKVPEEAKAAITHAIEASRKSQEEATKKITKIKIEIEDLKSREKVQVETIENLGKQETENTATLTKPSVPRVPKQKLNLDDYKNTEPKSGFRPLSTEASESNNPESSQTKKTKSDQEYRAYIIKAKEVIALLEQDSKNFQLLTDTIKQHKKKSAEHSADMMNQWINLTDETAANVSSQYSGYLSSTKGYLVSDRDYLINYSDSFYDILFDAGYLLAQQEAETLNFVLEKIKECVVMNTEEWIVSNELACSKIFFDHIPDLRKSYAERLTNGTSRLAEVDLLVIETIGKHARSAEDDIRGDIDSIARLSQLDSSIRSSFDNINRQVQQSQVQWQAANTSIKCYTTTNDSIFEKNRTYSTTCKPDTRTSQQICDEKIAAWLGNGAIVGSKPECN